MANGMITYMQTKYCGPDLQLGTQEKLAKVLYNLQSELLGICGKRQRMQVSVESQTRREEDRKFP